MLCKACALHLGYVPKSQRCCPYPCNGPTTPFANSPWRRQTVEDQSSAYFSQLHAAYKRRLEQRLADLVTVPEREREPKARELTAEVTKEYHDAYYKAQGDAAGVAAQQEVTCTCER